MDTRDKVNDIVINILSSPANEIKDDSNLTGDFNMDEFDLESLMMGLEEAFNISIPDADADWIFVKDVVEYIEDAKKE